MADGTSEILERIDTLSDRFTKRTDELGTRISDFSTAISRDIGNLEGTIRGHGREIGEVKAQIGAVTGELNRSDDRMIVRLDERLKHHVEECQDTRDRTAQAAREAAEAELRANPRRTSRPPSRPWYNARLVRILFYVGVVVGGGIAAFYGGYELAPRPAPATVASP